jgi:16S rRNA (uracil1498-N3)-methyltransferase
VTTRASAGRGSLPDGRGGPHVFVADIDAPVLDEEDRHHLQRVLRVRAGDPITASDGRGRWRPARFGPEIEPAGAVVTVPAALPSIGVAVSLVKGQRPELVVQKLTEIGVDRIVLMEAGRAVVRWEEGRVERNLRRLAAVARSAAQQSRQVRIPSICGPVPVPEVASGGAVSMAQRGGEPLSLDRPTLLIGPEGGWTAEELALGAPLVDLGPSVLRAETAAIVGGALLAAMRSEVLASHAE